MQPFAVALPPLLVQSAAEFPVIPRLGNAFPLKDQRQERPDVIAVGLPEFLFKSGGPRKIVPHRALRIEHGLRQHPSVVRVGEETDDRIAEIRACLMQVFLVDQFAEQFARQVFLKRREAPVRGLHDHFAVHKAEVLLFQVRRDLSDPSADRARREIVSVVDPHPKSERPACLAGIPHHGEICLAEVFLLAEAALGFVEQHDPAEAFCFQLLKRRMKSLIRQFFRVGRRDEIERDRTGCVDLFFVQMISHAAFLSCPYCSKKRPRQESFFHRIYLPLYLVGNSCYTSAIFETYHPGGT